MELQGTVKKIFDTQTFGSGFQKRELILLTEESSAYPQPIKIEFLSEKISLLDSLSEGDSVKVSINIRGREWTNPQGEVVYFNSITGWRIDRDGSTPATEPTAPATTEPKTEAVNDANPFANDADDDDLPF